MSGRIPGFKTISASEKPWTLFIKGRLSDTFMDIFSDAILTLSDAFMDIVSETMVISSDAIADTSKTRWVLCSRTMSEVGEKKVFSLIHPNFNYSEFFLPMPEPAHCFQVPETAQLSCLHRYIRDKDWLGIPPRLE